MQTLRVDAANLSGGFVQTITSTYNSESELTSVTDPSATINFTRDNLGRATTIQNILGSFAATHFTFHQGFDSVGNRTELRGVHGTSNDFKNTYTYDKLRRLTDVTQTSQPGGSAVLPKRVALEYNALGQRTKISRFESTGTTNAVATTDFTYDFANRLSSIAHKKGITNLNTHSYTYDPLSRLRSITSTLDGTINYTYDQRSQLTIADDGQPYSPGHPTRLGERYQYDADGNRAGTGFTVLADNRITAAPGETYTYDNEGNVVGMVSSTGAGSKTFQWDHRNRLIQSMVNTGSGTVTVSYAYDAFNRLVKRSARFNTTYFGYDEGINPHLQMETQSSNQITHRYLWSDQVDELFADEQRLSGLVPDTKWALSDHQGTIKDIADFNPTTGQTSVRHRAYDSFGNRKGSALTTDIVFGYTGKYFDETTALQNSWNRWYSPKMGRFISQDPIGFAGGDANLYRYVGNGPTNATDPSGLFEDPTDKETIDLPNVIGQVTGKRGIKIVPYSPLLGSLDRQLAEEYYSRAITGCFVLPRFSRNRIAIFRDDGFVSGGTATQRGDFLVDYAIAQGIPADGNFHNVKVPEWTNIYRFVDRVGLGDFWISTPHTLGTYGSYEIRLDGKVTTGIGTLQNATVRKIDLVWRLTDRVDANSIWEFKWSGGGWKQVMAGCVEVTVGDIIGDKIMGGSYDLEVYFGQREGDNVLVQRQLE